ncbi:MAG: hypothetical protein K2K46_01890, partial [Lachnospiraceae bacterium]|nr:hypothetical protein [Lachnospiraceae bacterium]
MRRKIQYFMALAAIGAMIGVGGCGNADETQITEDVSQTDIAQAETSQSDTELANSNNTPEDKELVYTLPTEPEEAEVYVEPIENLSEDFIRGVDISSVIAEEEIGVIYYNENGE